MDMSIWAVEHREEVTKELIKLWRLSWPVSATFLLNMSLHIVTVMFVGRLGPSKMAAASLGSSMAVVTGVPLSGGP
jgi:Na+-driven multidrug efflux pump